MAESANLTLIRRQYANVGNRAVAEQLMAPDVVWDITPGFPLGRPAALTQLTSAPTYVQPQRQEQQ